MEEKIFLVRTDQRQCHDAKWDAANQRWLMRKIYTKEEYEFIPNERVLEVIGEAERKPYEK